MLDHWRRSSLLNELEACLVLILILYGVSLGRLLLLPQPVVGIPNSEHLVSIETTPVGSQTPFEPCASIHAVRIIPSTSSKQPQYHPSSPFAALIVESDLLALFTLRQVLWPLLRLPHPPDKVRKVLVIQELQHSLPREHAHLPLLIQILHQLLHIALANFPPSLLPLLQRVLSTPIQLRCCDGEVVDCVLLKLIQRPHWPLHDEGILGDEVRVIAQTVEIIHSAGVVGGASVKLDGRVLDEVDWQ